jgi:hypothetical protein
VPFSTANALPWSAPVWERSVVVVGRSKVREWIYDQRRHFQPRALERESHRDVLATLVL